MAFHFLDMNDEIRSLMLEELSIDKLQGQIYISSRLTEIGTRMYEELLTNSINVGNEVTLANELVGNNCIKEFVPRQTKSGTTMVKTPSNAHLVLAEGEFNRYYIRAIARKVIESQKGTLRVYRAKQVSRTRIESDRLLGTSVEPSNLLKDLRDNIGLETILGIPGGPGSGLSVRIV
jgi:hypothetical protein